MRPVPAEARPSAMLMSWADRPTRWTARPAGRRPDAELRRGEAGAVDKFLPALGPARSGQNAY